MLKCYYENLQMSVLTTLPGIITSLDMMVWRERRTLERFRGWRR
jgi:hypothetical protein